MRNTAQGFPENVEDPGIAPVAVALPIASFDLQIYF